MANLSLVLAALRSSVNGALAVFSAGPYHGEVFLEYPVSTEIVKAVSSDPDAVHVSVWPLPGAVNQTRYPVEAKTTASLAPPGTTATINGTSTILTIGGTPTAGDVVHAFFSDPLVDAAHRVATAETTVTIATALAAAANAYALPGVTATASGSTVTLTGAIWKQINVGASGSLSREITRVERLIDVTIWASTSEARFAVGEAILAVLGGANLPTLLCSDGTRANIWYGTDKVDEAPSESYSLFKWHIIFRVEYGITQEVAVTQVEGVEWTQRLGSSTPQTSYAGGTA